MVMRRIALIIAFMAGLSMPALAQRAEIEAVNAKWVDLFNKGKYLFYILVRFVATKQL